MSETIFSKIINRELSADIVYEDDDILAFRDISPQAPVHVLVIPKVKIATVNDIQPVHAELIGNMVLVAQKIARQEGIDEDGGDFKVSNSQNRNFQTYRTPPLRL